MRSQCRLYHCLAAIAVLVIELMIAIWAVPGGFVRGSFGDVLAVVFLYHAIQAIFMTRPAFVAACAFAFSCGLEALQYLNFADFLGLAPRSALRTLLGSTFSFGDILMYFVGTVLVFTIDLLLDNRLQKYSRTRR